MADILSLSKARKAKARAEKEALAAQNRIKFGRTKAERQKDKAADAQSEAKLDAHKRDEP